MNPTHNTAVKIMKLHGLEIVGVDMEDDGIDLDNYKRPYPTTLYPWVFSSLPITTPRA